MASARGMCAGVDARAVVRVTLASLAIVAFLGVNVIWLYQRHLRRPPSSISMLRMHGPLREMTSNDPEADGWIAVSGSEWEIRISALDSGIDFWIQVPHLVSEPTPVHRMVVPFWAASLVSFVLILPVLARYGRNARGRRRQALGHCLRCGYDLRASKDRCPECGTPIPGGVPQSSNAGAGPESA